MSIFETLLEDIRIIIDYLTTLSDEDMEEVIKLCKKLKEIEDKYV